MSFFDDLSPLGRSCAGAALVAAAPVAAAAAIPRLRRHRHRGRWPGAPAPPPWSRPASPPSVRWRPPPLPLATAMGGVGVAEAVKDVRE